MNYKKIMNQEVTTILLSTCRGKQKPEKKD